MILKKYLKILLSFKRSESVMIYFQLKFENLFFNQFSKNSHAKGWWSPWKKKLSKSEELWLIRQVDIDILSFIDEDVDKLGNVQLNTRN